MYKCSSNQSGDLAESIVIADIIKRGYVPLLPTSRDHIYDILVERNYPKFGAPIFETIQVKCLRGAWVHTSTRPQGNFERVSVNGKPRNSTSYADYCIAWIAGVDTSSEKIYYYPLEVYRQHERINVKKIAPTDFGYRDVPSSRQPQTPDDTTAPVEESQGLWSPSEKILRGEESHAEKQ